MILSIFGFEKDFFAAFCPVAPSREPCRGFELMRTKSVALDIWSREQEGADRPRLTWLFIWPRVSGGGGSGVHYSPNFWDQFSEKRTQGVSHYRRVCICCSAEKWITIRTDFIIWRYRAFPRNFIKIHCISKSIISHRFFTKFWRNCCKSQIFSRSPCILPKFSNRACQ